MAIAASWLSPTLELSDNLLNTYLAEEFGPGGLSRNTRREEKGDTGRKPNVTSFPSNHLRGGLSDFPQSRSKMTLWTNQNVGVVNIPCEAFHIFHTFHT